MKSEASVCYVIKESGVEDIQKYRRLWRSHVESLKYNLRDQQQFRPRRRRKLGESEAGVRSRKHEKP
jgi:hypothetical protein